MKTTDEIADLAKKIQEQDSQQALLKGCEVIRDLLSLAQQKDPDNMAGTTFNALGVRETVFILDLKTMKILQVIHGSTAGSGTSSAQQAMTIILSMLGPKGG